MITMVLKIGHRGAGGHRPENTISSIKKAIELKADLIEFDVQKCRSGEIVLFHDRKLDKIGAKGKISEKTIDEIRRLRVEDQKIPTLEEAINTINRKAIADIEIKSKDTADSVSRVLNKFIREGFKPEDFIVTSFFIKEIEKIKKVNPEIRAGLIMRRSQLNGINKAISLGVDIIIIRYRRINKKIVEKIHENKMKVYVNTLNKEKDIERAKKLGVDGIISDFPERI